jgi:hypothetical protein
LTRRHDSTRTLETLTALTWVYLALAATMFFVNRSRLVALLHVAFLPPAAGAPGRPEHGIKRSAAHAYRGAGSGGVGRSTVVISSNRAFASDRL